MPQCFTFVALEKHLKKCKQTDDKNVNKQKTKMQSNNGYKIKI